MSNDLILIEKLNAVDLFKNEEAVQDILSKIEKEAKSVIPDISTDQGRKSIASMAYKVARTKTALDDLGKDLTETARKQIDAVNKGRKEIRDRLDVLKDEVRAPLTEFEEREKRRIAEREDRIQAIINLNRFEFLIQPSSQDIADNLDIALKLYETSDDGTPYNWEEFQYRAEEAYKKTIASLKTRYEAVIKREEEAAELEKLRKEKEEREKREHEERIAENARLEAERKALAEAALVAAKAKAEQERIQAEKLAAEQALIEAEKKAEQDRKEAVERERKAKEQAEIDRIAAEKKAAEEKEAAVQAERDRQEAEKKAEQDAIAKREADTKHRARINGEARDDIKFALSDGYSEEPATAIVTAIVKGQIRNVKINY